MVEEGTLVRRMPPLTGEFVGEFLRLLELKEEEVRRSNGLLGFALVMREEWAAVKRRLIAEG